MIPSGIRVAKPTKKRILRKMSRMPSTNALFTFEPPQQAILMKLYLKDRMKLVIMLVIILVLQVPLVCTFRFSRKAWFESVDN